MKFNKKITVTALSTVLGLGLVGSISGAVAWYQYSTRATTSIIGTSVGNGGRLELKVDGGSQWKTDLKSAELGVDGDLKFVPVTFGGFANNAQLPANAYKEARYGVKEMANWSTAVAGKDYLQYTFSARANQMAADGSDSFVNKKLYLTQVYINNHAGAGSKDIDDAVRVHIQVGTGETAKYYLFAKSATTINPYGQLDLNGDGAADTTNVYEWETAGTAINYGNYSTGENPELDTTALTSYASDDSTVIATLNADGTVPSEQASKAIGETGTSADGLQIKVTIWLEGWAIFGENTRADWTINQAGLDFDVGLKFDIDSSAFKA